MLSEISKYNRSTFRVVPVMIVRGLHTRIDFEPNENSLWYGSRTQSSGDNTSSRMLGKKKGLASVKAKYSVRFMSLG